VSEAKPRSAAPQGEVTAAAAPPSMLRQLWDQVGTLLLAVAIALGVRACVIEPFRIPSGSMLPTLLIGDHLFVNKFVYGAKIPFTDVRLPSLREPQRGDVVVFDVAKNATGIYPADRRPDLPTESFVKRLVGLPGDTIEINGQGQVILNGAVLNEPYIAGATNCNAQCDTIRIPEAGSPESRARCGSDACYFVMGDNRQNSSDSRQGWLVPEENIIGKAVVTYWHDGGPEFDLAPNHSVSADESGH